ncbi:SRPBCC domain-containing protein [Hymenobacter sp. DH14]|uniref:SRPBCC domain-containing protein n=1 Tax=Hymenobacter cyanobacteriorum TaxID=2926463 RepID=A0A9X1VEM7_9BACT|nr:SRPBCC domain-containing protein [Hymenobacter cyanobacteriorum]MCI1187774.1 SRPBCC domain-containing protein [Hymenobacter cyanobacteriorum]
MNTPFIIEQVYEAPIEKVWHALTNKDAMKAWYFPQLQKFEPVAEFKFEFANDGSPYGKEWVVTDVVPGRKLAHTWAYKNYPGSSEVTFGLTAQGAKTRLTLTHIGLESFPADPHFARRRFEDGWAQILGRNLKEYLEITS